MSFAVAAFEGVDVDRLPHRLHRRARLRAGRPVGRRRPRCGTRCWPPASRRRPAVRAGRARHAAHRDGLPAARPGPVAGDHARCRRGSAGRSAGRSRRSGAATRCSPRRSRGPRRLLRGLEALGPGDPAPAHGRAAPATSRSARSPAARSRRPGKLGIAPGPARRGRGRGRRRSTWTCAAAGRGDGGQAAVRAAVGALTCPVLRRRVVGPACMARRARRGVGGSGVDDSAGDDSSAVTVVDPPPLPIQRARSWPGSAGRPILANVGQGRPSSTHISTLCCRIAVKCA